MSIEIKWINHASFRISAGGSVLYIDPWKLEGSPHDADLVFVSHSHYDHCSPEDVAKVSRAGTAVVAPADTAAKLGAAKAAAPGEKLTANGITIETTAAYNIGKKFHPRGNNWLGAVFTIAGKRIYYSGDSDLVPEMSDLKDVDVALLPVGGTYTLDGPEAAAACRAIGPKAAIPYHWGDIVGGESDAKKFAKAAPCKVHILKPGESITL